MTTTDLPTWVVYLQAAATPIIGAIVAYIAWRQWRTAHQRMVIDLFDKRFEAFLSLREIVGSVCQTGKFPDKDVNLVVTQAMFLFPTDIAEEFAAVHRECSEMLVERSMGTRDPIASLRSLTEKLRPYMQLPQRL